VEQKFIKVGFVAIDMFQGTATLTLDAKGRFAIPALHREALARTGEEALTITAHPDGCLLLYPRSVWQQVQEKLMRSTIQDAQRLKRILNGNARDDMMDSAGRLLIAPELRKLARLERKIVMAGMGKRFELWDEAAWERQNDLSVEVKSLMPPGLEDLLQ
jgi:MraZ protein